MNIVFSSFQVKGVNNNQPVEEKSPQRHSLSTVGLMLDIYRPTVAALSKQKLPVVLYIHGGGFVKGYKSDISACLVHAVMKSGSVLVTPEYRLAPYGTIREQLKDIHTCLEWLEHTGESVFDLDVSRITIIGFSAGAFLAGLVALQHKHRAIHTVNTDNPEPPNHIEHGSRVKIVGFIGLSGVYNISDTSSWGHDRMQKLCKRTALQTEGRRVNSMKWLEASPAWWTSSLWSSTHHLKTQSADWSTHRKLQLTQRSYLSTLLIHGTHDNIAPYRLARQFHDILKRDNDNHLNALFPIEHGHHGFDWTADAKSVLVSDTIHLYLVWNNYQCTHLTADDWTQSQADIHRFGSMARG
jgi:acetyl esterase/lipase